MQSNDSFQKLNALDRDLLEQRIRSLYEARVKSDLAGLLQNLADDIVCFPRSSWGHATFPNPIVGKEAVAEAFRLRTIQYENLGNEIHKLLIDGDTVAVHRTTTLRDRGGSLRITFDAIDFFRFRDGLVVEFAQYPDGLCQEGDRELPALSPCGLRAARCGSPAACRCTTPSATVIASASRIEASVVAWVISTTGT